MGLGERRVSVSAAGILRGSTFVTPEPWWRGDAAAAIGDLVTGDVGNDEARSDTVFTVRTDGLGRLQLCGELDMASAPTLSRAMQPAMTRGGVVELDASRVTFMDSAGIHVLLEAVRELGERGRVVLVHPSPVVQRVIEICGLDGILDVTDRHR